MVQQSQDIMAPYTQHQIFLISGSFTELSSSVAQIANSITSASSRATTLANYQMVVDNARKLTATMTSALTAATREKKLFSKIKWEKEN